LPVQVASQGFAWQRESVPQLSGSGQSASVVQPWVQAMGGAPALGHAQGTGSQICPGVVQSASVAQVEGPGFVSQMPQPSMMGGTMHWLAPSTAQSLSL
jgi:hypothetical protein